MGAPKEKYFGNLQIDALNKAMDNIPAKLTNHEKYGKQFKVQAAQWDDGKITLSVWNSETKETFKLGSLILSQFQPEDKKTNGYG